VEIPPQDGHPPSGADNAPFCVYLGVALSHPPEFNQYFQRLTPATPVGTMRPYDLLMQLIDQGGIIGRRLRALVHDRETVYVGAGQSFIAPDPELSFTQASLGFEEWGSLSLMLGSGAPQFPLLSAHRTELLLQELHTKGLAETTTVYTIFAYHHIQFQTSSPCLPQHGEPAGTTPTMPSAAGSSLTTAVVEDITRADFLEQTWPGHQVRINAINNSSTIESVTCGLLRVAIIEEMADGLNIPRGYTVHSNIEVSPGLNLSFLREHLVKYFSGNVNTYKQYLTMWRRLKAVITTIEEKDPDNVNRKDQRCLALYRALMTHPTLIQFASTTDQGIQILKTLTNANFLKLIEGY